MSEKTYIVIAAWLSCGLAAAMTGYILIMLFAMWATWFYHSKGGQS